MKNKSGTGTGSNPPPRKMRFVPKPPPQKQGKLALKEELSVINDDVIDKELIAKVKSLKSQDVFGKLFKTDKKASPAEVSFGYGSTSTSARSFGTPKECKSSKSDDITDPASRHKEYVEPWDYNSYYPTTLPWRRPYSGDPEILDKLEFGEGGTGHIPIDESRINAAHYLGLTEASNEPKLMFLQFPMRLPPVKPTEEVTGPSCKTADASKMATKLKDLPAGFMGKLLVYKSGKVKMKLGDVLYDVTPGADHKFSEEVVAVNAKEKQFCVLGELSRHAVVTPDVDSLLDASDDSQ
ncbi:hypothetical protein AXF42_Ash011450 [Apostasia shenzhenica]|uniref:DNA-directed RNA polymerase III subunit RPC4 n=1 Tax=Apostasia shenzhenica TaxID=1088818 RepID=A0A2I0BAM1_9ASPA|nr:hypothetical protein AXF42_Ash011450 [Apostasia shenzhenica]